MMMTEKANRLHALLDCWRRSTQERFSRITPLAMHAQKTPRAIQSRVFQLGRNAKRKHARNFDHIEIPPLTKKKLRRADPAAVHQMASARSSPLYKLVPIIPFCPINYEGRVLIVIDLQKSVVAIQIPVIIVDEIFVLCYIDVTCIGLSITSFDRIGNYHRHAGKSSTYQINLTH